MYIPYTGYRTLYWV